MGWRSLLNVLATQQLPRNALCDVVDSLLVGLTHFLSSRDTQREKERKSERERMYTHRVIKLSITLFDDVNIFYTNKCIIISSFFKNSF